MASGGPVDSAQRDVRPHPDLWRSLAVLAEPPAPGHARVAEALGLPPLPDASAYDDIFTFQLYPYASVDLGAEGMVGGEARSRVEGFWRAVGVEPPEEPDHLAALLGLYASLAERAEQEKDRARGALAQSARDALFREHIACWLPPYLAKLREMASGFYAAWAELLAGVVLAEQSRMRETNGSWKDPAEAAAGQSADERRQRHAGAGEGGGAVLPVHLRSAPPFAEGQPASVGELVRALLTPARSGMILTRADLHACAAELGVGAIRMSERALLLEDLLSADPAGTVRWLREQAEEWRGSHVTWGLESGSAAAAFWEERAQSTVEALRSMA